MDKLSGTQRSLLMSRIGTKETDIEKKFLKYVKPLFKGDVYKKNVKKLPGKPDILLTKNKIAIFIDGDFWHGRNFKKNKKKLSPFWKKKIGLNIKRDKAQGILLRKMGYKVVRFWGAQVKYEPDLVKNKMKEIIKNSNRFAARDIFR